MIKIIIDKSNEVNPILSKKSAYISCPYIPEIVEYIRNLMYRHYDANNKIWEIQEKDLRDFCIKFGQSHGPIDITDDYIEPTQQIFNNKIPQNYKFLLPLYNHQKEGIEFGLNHPNFLLGDEMGLGKTLQSLYTTDIECKSGKVLIIVCSATLKYNWKEEIKKTLGKDARVLGTREKYRKKWDDTITYEGNGQDKYDDLCNLDNIPEKYIITNRETLTLLKKKKGRGYIYTVAEKIEELCKSGKIEAIIVDEFHIGCVAGDTLITTEKGKFTIKEIIEKQLNYKVLSLNTKTGQKEYKSIKDYFYQPTNKKMLELIFKDKKIRYKIQCTENHKFYTKNRGWVAAKDLTEEDDIEPLLDKRLKKQLDNKEIDYVKENINKILFSDIANKLNISNHCLKSVCDKYNIFIDKQKNSELSKKHREEIFMDFYGVKNNAEKNREKSSIRMKLHNPSSDPIINKKATKHRMATRKKNGTWNCWNAGNGVISPTEKLVKSFLESLGFKYNKGISTRKYKESHPALKLPVVYKPDFIHKSKKICIELDGATHNSKKAKELDAKKDKVEKDLGYKVYRFTNDFISNHLEEFKQNIKEILNETN